MPTTILIVDDSAVVRRSVRFFIEQNTDWKICDEAENGAIAVEKVKQLRPTVVILDLAMPVMNGLEAARLISSVAPNTTTLLFTMHHCDELLNDARAAGIKEVLSKCEGPAVRLIDSIRALVGH